MVLLTQGFDITSAIKSAPVKLSNKERRKLRDAQEEKRKRRSSQKKLEEEKAAKELQEFKADSDWNKAMMERFMYEDESSSDEEDSDED